MFSPERGTSGFRLVPPKIGPLVPPKTPALAMKRGLLEQVEQEITSKHFLGIRGHKTE